MGTKSENNCAPYAAVRGTRRGTCCSSWRQIIYQGPPLRDRRGNRCTHRLGILKVCTQERRWSEKQTETHLDSSALLNVGCVFIYLFFAFEWGWIETVSAHYCKSSTAGGVRTMTGANAVAQPTVFFINSAWWDTPLLGDRGAHKKTSETRWQETVTCWGCSSQQLGCLMRYVYDTARLYRGCGPPEEVCLGKRGIYLSVYFMFFHIKFKNDYKRSPDYNLKSPGGQFQNCWTHSNNGFMMLHPTGLRDEQKKNNMACFPKSRKSQEGRRKDFDPGGWSSR